MVDIAPLNYERWAVIVSPLQVQEVQGGGYAVPLRHPEGLVQVGASLSRLDSRKKESLIEQKVPPPEQRHKVSRSKPQPPPPLPIKSHPPDCLLRQPLPMAAIASARNQTVVIPGKVIGLYTPPEVAFVPSMRVSG